MNSCLDCRYYDSCSSCFENLSENGCNRFKTNEKKPNRVIKKPTLCWNCTRIDCPWMPNFEPVAGWDTVKSSVRHKTKYGVVYLPSYRVISRPGYTPRPVGERTTEEDR